MNYSFSDTIHIKLERVVYRFKVQKKHYSHGRDANGFIYYIKSGHRFDFKDGSITTQSGDFVYIPYNAVYENTVLSDGTEYYQVDFLLYNDNGSSCLFNDFQIVNNTEATDYHHLIKEIYNTYFSNENFYKILCIGNICRLITMIALKSEQKDLKQNGIVSIYISMSYIKEHFNGEIPIEKLAKISNISISNLEKSFEKCYGATPVAYINKIRMEESKKLLLNGFSIPKPAYEQDSEVNIIISVKCSKNMQAYLQEDLYPKITEHNIKLSIYFIATKGLL